MLTGIYIGLVLEIKVIEKNQTDQPPEMVKVTNFENQNNY